ncbi:S-layer homology domain-containing protein [Paenibacillus sp. GXUN7292]|uniref:S-layer homology domain-containing protein n=1 Tax=Paenibacillus sp. GXUN7292 TaxID=3422499 RepID=UPI003D7D1A4C
MKKLLSLIVAFALVISLVPAAGIAPSASAAGVYFLFPNEQSTAANARIVSTSTIQLQGTINQVVGNSISYNVKQVTLDDRVLNQTEEITTGIQTTGDNRITVSGLILFPGLNKITFKGISGASTVTESIYIEYRDSPMLYDLKINFENRDYDMLESEPTMLYSTAPNIVDRGQIVITGKAPNAQKVTIDINGRSYDFNVSTSSNDSRFSTSQLTIDKGINRITFKVLNGGQIVETTREVAFYNGEVTYYNLKITDSQTPPQVADLEPNLNFLTPSAAAGQIKVSGTAIIPLPLYDLTAAVPADRNNTVTVSKAALAKLLSMELQKGTSNSVSYPIAEDDITYTPTNPDASTKFITVNFSVSLPVLTFDETNRIRFVGPNLKQYSYSNWTSFIVRDSSLAYIYDINYLSGYDKSMTDSRILGLQGTDIPSGGVNVYTMPMAVEVLIGNYASLGTDYTKLFKVNGASETTGGSFKTLGANEIVYRTINNQQVPFLRTFVEISKLNQSGTNSIKFKIDRTSGVTAEEKTIIAKLLYGPYVKFDTLVNGMKVEYDSVRQNEIVNLLTKLGSFNGQIFNVANDDQVVYENTSTPSVKKQSVFMYINNVEIPLAENGSPTKFMPKGLNLSDTGANSVVTKISNILNKAGENTVKFVFRTDSNVYENTLKFSIVPTNLPVVPAPNTDGVYPYTAGGARIPNDPNFTSQGAVYTTKEAYFNVHGTFDFVDLGGEGQYVDGLTRITDKQNYKVVIDSPNWKQPLEWDLRKEFTAMKKNEALSVLNPNELVSTPDARVEFFYDVDDQYFYFEIINQMMPIDGSPQVYVITVFNSGDAGPRATYRLEVNSVSIPYSIKSPLKENMITNQNFVEIIIASPGADSITVGKEKAEKVTYIEYVQGLESYVDAFRVVYKNLGPNKDTKIPFTITRGKDTIKQEMVVRYVPTNIPGAQMLQSMASSHKVFNNALTLTFDKNTQLIRPHFNNSENLAGQVSSGHDILFAIANPNDGIVNRHEFESQPPNYSANSQAEGNLHIGYRFQDQARQFLKASPLFWVDAGMADDPDTPNKLDPIKMGMDPFPFPNLAGKHTDSFAKRWNEYGRELIPSKPGKLTLEYDRSIVDSAATTITVFRFDPYDSTWENIGGVVDSKKYTITVPFTKFGYYVAVKMTRGYNDITDHPYAREAMEAVFAKGIMNAIDPIGVFGGDRYVTRGEFTRMIVRALDLPLNYGGDNHFTYYPETITNANNSNAIYDYRYIETAARAGIVRGTRPGFFDEDVELSRQEGAVIIARALKLKLETDSTKAKNRLNGVFMDSGSFDFYSIPSVLAIQKKGFIQGKLIDPNNPKAGSVFDPKARLLRSDAAIIISKVMFDLKKLPKIYN